MEVNRQRIYEDLTRRFKAIEDALKDGKNFETATYLDGLLWVISEEIAQDRRQRNEAHLELGDSRRFQARHNA